MEKNCTVVFFILCVLFLAFTSCISTNVSTENVDSSTNLVSDELNSNQSNITDENTDSVIAIEPVIIEEVEPIVNPVENLSISSGDTPAQIRKNGTFKIPFSATVTNTEDNSPVAEIPVTVIYPKSRQNDTVTFESKELITNQDGIVSFEIPDTSFACNSFVTFKIGKDEFEKSVEIPYKVTTNRFNWGGTISILDYTKGGKPVTDNSLSASAILTSMIRGGFSGVGLADFINEIQSGNTENVYNAAYKLIGNNVSFLVFGTVKYNGEITKEGSTTIIPMIAEITCLEMKTGNELYHTVIEVEGKGNSEWAALNNARTELIGPQVTERIIYGL